MNLIAFDAFQGKWSDDIHREWTTHLVANGKDKKKVLRTKNLMDEHFPDAKVSYYKKLIKTLTLPDPDDRHVLAVAIKSHASFIITDNLKDFPKKHLPVNIQAISIDNFLLEISQKSPLKVIEAIKHHRHTLKNPPYSVDEYIEARKNENLKGFVVFLKEHKKAI